MNAKQEKRIRKAVKLLRLVNPTIMLRKRTKRSNTALAYMRMLAHETWKARKGVSSREL